MKLTYTNHARKRMKERNITEAEVLECVEDYDTTHTDKKGNPIYRAIISNGRRLEVILQKENPTKVITVVGD